MNERLEAIIRRTFGDQAQMDGCEKWGFGALNNTYKAIVREPARVVFVKIEREQMRRDVEAILQRMAGISSLQGWSGGQPPPLPGPAQEGRNAAAQAVVSDPGSSPARVTHSVDGRGR